MVSPARIAANRVNAKKSTGPKTTEGKHVARFNALTHGLTATLALLPDEDPAALEQERTTSLQIYKPRNAVELAKVERAVYLSWQIGRVQRAQSAKLCLRAAKAPAEKLARELEQTIGWSHQLLRPAPEVRWGATATTTSMDQATGAADPPIETEHPALLTCRLESLADGCRWLRQQWLELGDVLDAGNAWEAIDCFRASRLLGMQPSSMIDLPELSMFLRTCQALAGKGSELATESWKLIAPRDAERGFEPFRRLLTREAGPLDAEEARGQLKAIVAQEVERLADKAAAHDEMNEIEAELAPHRSAFDSSPDGEKMRRYEVACARMLNRIVDELDARSGSGVEESPLTYLGYRINPSLLDMVVRTNSRKAGSTDEIDASENTVNGAREGEIVSPAASGMDVPLHQEEPVRNEANGNGEPARNEANGVREVATAPVEVIRRHQVGCATVTRLSSAVASGGNGTMSRRERLARRQENTRNGQR